MSRVIRGKARVVPSEVVDASRKASCIVAEAETQAKTLVEAAHREAATIRETAQAQGESAGRADAAAVVLRAEQARLQTLKSSEPAVIRLAIEAAEKILRDTIEQEPEHIKKTVSALLERASRASGVAVRVHPSDVSLVEELRGVFSFDVTKDDALERGECIVESNLGELDARFSVQLAALEKALVDDDA